MFAGLLPTASQLIALTRLIPIRCFVGPTLGCVVATRFLIHRYASVNSVDQENAADDVPPLSPTRDWSRQFSMSVRLRDRRHVHFVSQRRIPPMIPALLSTTETWDGNLILTSRELPPPMYKWSNHVSTRNRSIAIERR